MRSASEQAKEVLKAVPGSVDLDLLSGRVDAASAGALRSAALARAGIAMEDAQRTLETALAGRVLTTMWEGERPVPIRLMLPQTARDDAERIGAITVASLVRRPRAAARPCRPPGDQRPNTLPSTISSRVVGLVTIV